MPDRDVDFFRALSDITRQIILELLTEHERCVNELCEEFEDMTQPTISHHLQILKHCNLVSTQRKGKMIYYSINRRILRNGFEDFIARFNIEML
ncbi:MAG: metalloregulator ArsR/SmtB family transcription factor [Candidatus Omnitrophota bacterium]|nr:metalloregulator ArsR/SmtB family transcription factor [Candidatus Omnitrophota bacterium]